MCGRRSSTTCSSARTNALGHRSPRPDQSYLFQSALRTARGAPTCSFGGTRAQRARACATSESRGKLRVPPKWRRACRSDDGTRSRRCDGLRTREGASIGTMRGAAACGRFSLPLLPPLPPSWAQGHRAKLLAYCCMYECILTWNGIHVAPEICSISQVSPRWPLGASFTD